MKVFWSETNRGIYVLFLGNIFISRKAVASCDDCDDEDGLVTSAVYKIGKMLSQFLYKDFLHLNL